ncbi:unnamed protein product [Hyaloperonospora brassicae]|uniref:Anaphase-promoting complex subunit 7 n=1 Tax=Hyaloperonospora brassicae TaxID=162125 RepID=A0AAV0UKR3_HYABA|nr:unnamed protein product [Hyaloperonospora brassicae]
MDPSTKKRRTTATELRPRHDASDTSSACAPAVAEYDAVMMQQQLEALIRSEDVDSAQILGDFLVALALAPSDSKTHSSADGGVREALPSAFHADTLRLFADLMVVRREFKRAIRYYHRSCRDMTVVTNDQELATKLKVARCYVHLDCIHEAIEMLRSTPQDARSVSMNLLLGRLYVDEGLPTKAEESYMTALKQNPYALEAAIALTKLAVAKDAPPDVFAGSSGAMMMEEGDGQSSYDASTSPYEMERCYTEDPATQKAGDGEHTQSNMTWMQILVTAHVDAERGNHQKAIESFSALDRVFPKNLHCLLHKAALEVDQELLHQAHVSFKRARQVDDLNVTFMDCYANCLRKGGSCTNLNDLVQELFTINRACPESWLAAAYYNDSKGDYETALQFCERAITERDRYAPAHLLRGGILLRMHHPQPALKAFWTSCRLTRSLEAYTGIITSYCDLYVAGVDRYKEAFATAKSVVRLFPKKAQSFVLFGSVLALSSEHRKQARQALQKALAMEPRKLYASIALADLEVEDGDLRGAIERLQALSERFPRDDVFAKLAYVYSMDKQFAEALKYFHQALRLNPTSSEALQGLDRLEKLMRGEDPDELSNSMEQVDTEGQEESMEASDYLSP